jgi:hypothetical protein
VIALKMRGGEPLVDMIADGIDLTGDRVRAMAVLDERRRPY